MIKITIILLLCILYSNLDSVICLNIATTETQYFHTQQYSTLQH